MGTNVAFDIGNVLIQFDINKFTFELSKKTGLKANESWNFSESLQKSQDIGITTVYQNLQNRFGNKNATFFAEMLDAWNSTLTANNKMLEFLENLKAQSIQVALLSNMGQEHYHYLSKTYPKMFDGTIQHISCEVGARKPTKLYYQSFLAQYPYFTRSCLGFQTIYVDDIDENLKMGEQYGFKGFKFDLDKFVWLSKEDQDQVLVNLENEIV